jgi:class 3 adenylate cyclase
MFSDLVGSTALSARMDPEDLREVISAYQKCVAETVQRFGGFVAKYMEISLYVTLVTNRLPGLRHAPPCKRCVFLKYADWRGDHHVCRHKICRLFDR